MNKFIHNVGMLVFNIGIVVVAVCLLFICLMVISDFVGVVNKENRQKIIEYEYSPDSNTEIKCSHLNWFTNIPSLSKCNDGKEYFVKEFSRAEKYQKGLGGR